MRASRSLRAVIKPSTLVSGSANPVKKPNDALGLYGHRRRGSRDHRRVHPGAVIGHTDRADVWGCGGRGGELRRTAAGGERAAAWCIPAAHQLHGKRIDAGGRGELLGCDAVPVALYAAAWLSGRRRRPYFRSISIWLSGAPEFTSRKAWNAVLIRYRAGLPDSCSTW